jgi:carbon storage regulator CsrA
MLVLSRKDGESITIKCPDGQEIKIIVVAIRGTSVRMGFDAPKSMFEIVRDNVGPDKRGSVNDSNSASEAGS